MRRSIAEQMEYPFAVPPVRRMLLVRVLPELFAAAVWGLFLWIWLQDASGLRLGLWETLGLGASRFAVVESRDVVGASLSRAAAVCAEVSAILLVLAPIAFVAPAFSVERQGGTLEAMLLTSTHHENIVTGRFWYVALPWFRLVIYFLPFYALLVLEPLLTIGCSGWSMPWLNLCGWTASLGRVTGSFVWENAVTPGPSPHTGFLAAMRLLHDVSAMLLAMVVTFHVSMRARNLARALIFSFLLAPPAVVLMAGPDTVWLLLASGLPGSFLGVRAYWLVVVVVIALRWGGAFGLLRRSAGNFDAYVLGEETGAPARARRRRGEPKAQSI